MKNIKIAVSGAAGQVAYAFLFRLLAESRTIFGEDVSIDLRLLELETCLQKALGVQMEIEDSAFFNLTKITATSDVNLAMNEADYAILIGAIPRSSSTEERSSLLKKNAALFKIQGKAINDFAAKNIKVLVVGNPCNTNCMIAMKNAPNISPDNFYALTMLDETRAKLQLAKKTNRSITSIKNIIIWGNHSNTQFPDFYHAMIDEKRAVEIIDEKWLQTDFLDLVRKRGAAIINARGISSGASAANGIIATLQNISHETNNGNNYSLACCSQGEYGIDPGLIFSFPCVTKNGKVKIVDNVAHQSDFAIEQLRLTLEELRAEKQMVENLLE